MTDSKVCTLLLLIIIIPANVDMSFCWRELLRKSDVADPTKMDWEALFCVIPLEEWCIDDYTRFLIVRGKETLTLENVRTMEDGCQGHVRILPTTE